MAVHLTRIYTRTGDDGSTGLSDFSRVPKTDPRVVAYADCDEANAVIGLALKATMGWRIDHDDELAGIDSAEHAESAYDFGGFASGTRVGHGLLPSGHGPLGGSTTGAEHNDPRGVQA